MTGQRPEDPIPYTEIAEIVDTWPTTRGYGPFIAGKYSITLPTARRWIAETRRRGFLPSGVDDRPCPACDGTGVARWGSRPRGATTGTGGAT